MNKRFQASYKIAAGFVVLALLAVYGYRFANDYFLGREHFAPLVPGDVNIVGVDPSAGYGIIVQNQVAKLVFGSSGSFGPGEMSDKALESTSDSERKYIPIKDMLKGLQGDIPGLSYFVQRLNDIKDDDLPSDAPVWKTEDLEKALKGDQALRTKLIKDLSIELDGTPLAKFQLHDLKSAMQNGIVVDTPVPLTIHLNGEPKEVVARVKRPFRPDFIKNVEGRVSQKFSDNKNEKDVITGEYIAAVEELNDGKLLKQDVASALGQFAQTATNLAEYPQRVLDSITIVITDKLITGASYRTVETNKGTSYVLDIELNDEGRKRLYQFTRNRINSQLLVTANGVAIGAPRIQEAISSGQVDVRGLEDETLVKDAVARINEKRATTTK